MEDEIDLVIRVGNFYIRGAYFSNDIITQTFHFKYEDNLKKQLLDELANKNIRAAFIGSNNQIVENIVKNTLTELTIDIFQIDDDNLSIKLDIEHPKELGMGRIANAYGALVLHPYTDSIVIDMETALTIDIITKERVFLGGVICPSMMLSAKALAENTDKLPLITVNKPKSCLSRSIAENIQSGIYFGLIGAIEKIVEEIISLRFSHSDIKVIATGGLAGYSETDDVLNNEELRNNLEKDLKVVVDYFEPDLTFIGLYQMLKEKAMQTYKI